MAGIERGKKPKIAVAQMRSVDDAEANLAQCRTLVKEAVKQGAALLSLPECFEYMGIPGKGDALKAAQPLSGPLLSQYRELAKAEGIWLSLGGFHEASPEPEKMYNTHVIVDSGGEIVASYRKLHLFDVDYDGGFRESATTIKGQEALLVRDTPVGNIGVTTCYDLRFPELYTALRRAGANVLLVPSAFMPSTGEAHWHVLLRARAIETQCYVAAAAQAGRHNEKRASFGHALIVDPWGKVVCDLGAEGTGIGISVIDPELLDSVRTRMPVLEHRRYVSRPLRAA